MNGRAITGHTLVLLAVLSGIVGMGLTFDAVADGNLGKVGIGVPLLCIGLWWAGHELGQSMTAHRARRPAALHPGRKRHP